MSRLLVLCCVLLHSVCLAQDATPTAPPSIDAFTRWDEFGDIKISPDGEFVAMSTGKYGRTAIAFIDLKNKKLVSGVRAPDPLEIFEFDWVSPTRIIYTIAQRYPWMKTPASTGEMFSINRDGTRHEQIYGYRAGEQQLGTRLKVRESSYGSAQPISFLKDDRDNILIAEHPWKYVGAGYTFDPDARPRIIRLDVYNGKKHDLGTAPLRAATMLVDQNDQVRFAFGLNTQFKLAVSWKPQPDAPWVRAAWLPR